MCPAVVNTSVTDGGNTYTSSTPIDNKGNSFKFPYDIAPKDGEIILDIKDESKGVYVTKLSNRNRYYSHFNALTNPLGLSSAIKISNKSLVKEFKGDYSNSCYNLAKKLDSFSTLANCVGWAHGRVNEIWGAAIDSGYIVKSGGNWVIPSRNNQIVSCDVGPSMLTTPSCAAYNFYSNWPDGTGLLETGWYKTTQYKDDIRPLPGAIICWRNMSSSNGLNGHVAVVEAVFDYGAETESILISQSAYSDKGAKKLVWTDIVRRNNYKCGAPYGYYDNYKFAGFLFSPVCQLLPVGGYYASGQSSYNLQSVEDLEKYKATEAQMKTISSASKSTIIKKDLLRDDKVAIKWFGSTTPEETNSKINLLGSKGVIISIDNSKAYQYAVSITGDGKVSGYFQRDALSLIEEV